MSVSLETAAKRQNMKLAVATATSISEPDQDHKPLSDALAKAGIDFEWMAWDDPRADFKNTRMTLLRSTWNYVEKREQFLAWADNLGMRVMNPPVVVRWNTHKRYMKELADAGLPTVETVLVPKGVSADLGALMKKKHWFKAVAKPAVGAGSYLTRVVSSADADWFRDRLAERDMLLQPFMWAVETDGERCIVTIEGEPTHAVRKEPRFENGVEKTTAVAIEEDERVLAKSAVAWIERALPCGKLLYARVDMVRDLDNRPRIMELELVEPSLFFVHSPDALERFVAGVKWRMETLSIR